MPTTPLKATQVAELLRQYEIYDQHVDVVSAMHALLTQAKELKSTVQHFERFPVIKNGDAELTPDFTILFTDGTAIIGEIASVALHDNSVTSLLNQLGRYDAIRSVPSSGGQTVNVECPDVLLFVPVTHALNAFQRVSRRLADPGDAYRPSKPPVIAQYAKGDSQYTLQRLQHPSNGKLDPGSRTEHLGLILDRDCNVKANLFIRNKVRFRFMNDAPADLYLATHLVQHYLPSQYPSGKQANVVPAEVAETLRAQYGGGVRAKTVTRALDLLHKAGAAAKNADGSWDVSLKPLKSRSEQDTHRIILERATKKSPPKVVPRARPDTSLGQLALF